MTTQVTLQTYSALATVTAAPFPAQTAFPANIMNRYHGILGMASECVGELPFASTLLNFQEELGDVAWFLSLYLTATEQSFASLVEELLPTFTQPPADALDFSRTEHDLVQRLTNHDSTRRLSATMGAVLDLMKREMFYGKPIPENAMDFHLDTILTDVLTLACLSFPRDLTPTESLTRVLEMNIHKLATRYPDGFSQHNLVFRDLASETSAMIAVKALDLPQETGE